MLYDRRTNVRGGAVLDTGTLLSCLMGLVIGVMITVALAPNI